MRLSLINEGYASIFNFGYGKFKTDPKPRLLLLGKWRHPTTRNILLAGLNINYMSDDQLLQLRQNLPNILKPRSLKARYWRGRALLPDVFNTSWRTYDKSWVTGITRDTLKFYPSVEELEKAEQEKGAEEELADKGLEAPKPEEVPIEPIETPAERRTRQKMARKVKKPVTPKKPTSAQERRTKAAQIKAATEKQQATQPPPPPPEPPEEIKGVLGLFKRPT